MRIRNCIIILVISLGISSCKEENNQEENSETTKFSATDLQVDHFNIWVKNPQKAKQRLTDIGFIAIPDSLSKIHLGQGTTGRYFYFLNSYLELIFVYDQNELEDNNRKNKDLDFTKRANFDINGASPFSIALKIKDYEVEKIPFKKVTYHQEWMDKNENIYTAKNSKTHLKEPSIFVVYPEIEGEVFEKISDLKRIPEEYALWREFYKHPNGAKKITNISVTSTDLDVSTETIKTINKIENINIKNGSEHLMQLYFDNNIQGKTFDLRPELPLIIHL